MSLIQAKRDETKFTALPWNSEAQIASLDLWIALRTTFQAKFRFQDDFVDDLAGDVLDSIDIRGGLYIDTPIINATAKSLSGVKEDCSSGGGLQNVLDVDLSHSWSFGAYISGTVSRKLPQSSCTYRADFYSMMIDQFPRGPMALRITTRPATL